MHVFFFSFWLLHNESLPRLAKAVVYCLNGMFRFFQSTKVKCFYNSIIAIFHIFQVLLHSDFPKYIKPHWLYPFSLHQLPGLLEIQSDVFVKLPEIFGKVFCRKDKNLEQIFLLFFKLFALQKIIHYCCSYTEQKKLAALLCSFMV